MPKDTLVNAGVFGSSGESESAEIDRKSINPTTREEIVVATTTIQQ